MINPDFLDNDDTYKAASFDYLVLQNFLLPFI